MFSLSQRLKFYQPMIDKAWAAHCRREDITEDTAASKKEFERGELKSVFGVDSTANLNKGKHFDQAMAHFEELANDGSIFWQMKLIKGDARRAQYLLTETIRLLHLKPEYIATIAEQMQIPEALRTDKLSAENAVNLRIALLYHVRRKQEKVTTQPELPS